MKKACKDQCADCPFRSTSIPNWLGGYQGPEAVFSSLWHTEPFFCHTRTDYTRADWLARANKTGQLCNGALIFVESTSYFPKSEDPEVREAVLDVMARFRATPEKFDVLLGRAFIDHHKQDVDAWVKIREAAGVKAPLAGILSTRRRQKARRSS